jgi:cytochrome P450
MLPILGKTSLVTVYGDYWKKVRKMFNPAFAVSHLETLVPGIIEESMDFVDILDKYAKSGEEIKLGQRLPVIPLVRQLI